MKKAIPFIIVLLLTSYASAATSWIDATAIQESGNKPKAPYWDKTAMRLGYFAISNDYWGDAVAFDKSLGAKHGGSWERCQNDRDYGAKVVMAYMRRYCPKAVAANDWETMSRVHNGGLGGLKNKKATDGYWTSVKRIMEVGHK